MGAVYEARHVKLKKAFALNVLRPGFASKEAALTRSMHESQAIEQLASPFSKTVQVKNALDALGNLGIDFLHVQHVHG